MNKRGISLVALVVTIIVLIILTGAVVASFMEGGIIDKAKEAVMKSDCSTLIEAYNVAYNTAKIDEVTGTGEKVNRIAILEKVVNELGLKGFSFSGETVEYNGDNDEIKEWINSNFIFIGLEEAGYILSTVNGTTYLTGIQIEVEDTATLNIITTVEDILENLPEGYIIVDNLGNLVSNTDIVTTGYKIMNGEEECVTIIVKGDIYVDDKEGIDDDDCMFLDLLAAGMTDELEQYFDRRETEADIIACDVNNDGFISQEDVDIINDVYAELISGTIIVDAQKSEISKIPTVENN